MGKHRYDNRRRPVVILDAGYVSINTNDIYTSKILGLHGTKLICVILTVFFLFSISFINLTCLVWIMYKLDWSPFHKNGSKIFQFDQINQQVKLYYRGIIEDTIYTTKIEDSLEIDFLSENQIDMYGDHDSILFDDNQISMNTEYFHINNEALVDFNNLESFKFEDKTRTRIHLDRINSKRIYSKHLNITANNYLTVSNVNTVVFSGQNLNIEGNRSNHRSILRFGNYPRRKKLFNRQQKTLYENIDFKIDSIFLDLPRLPLVENPYRSESSIYRICICNTTFLLLQSFAHQPCPLC
ncbi:unnamed protein product [Rotaria sordida]|uniref:Uncharacterized protein n=1 Tax=Rotaria sordida TaxID=392033 RepID=A0A813W1S1_9BILA|nr:unnamed protein product [Rotaria sordida]CAF0942113.1 unnamed protein product [Rotaria sordida]